MVAEEVATKEFLDDAKLLDKMQDTDTSSVEPEIDLTQYIHPPIWTFYCGFGGMGDRFDLLSRPMQPYLKLVSSRLSLEEEEEYFNLSLDTH